MEQHFNFNQSAHDSQAATDEVYNLYVVAFGEGGVRPVSATDDLPIAFDGEPFGNERELEHKLRERRALLYFAPLSIDFDEQKFPDLAFPDLVLNPAG